MYKKAQICNLIILNLSELCLTILSAVWAINKLVQSQVSNFGSCFVITLHSRIEYMLQYRDRTFPCLIVRDK